MTDDRQPATDEDLALIDGWTAWVADHAEPAAVLDSHDAIMDHLTGLLAEDFIAEYGGEEFFAFGIVWGEALRMKNDGWKWVSIPTEEGRTLVLDVSADDSLADPQALVAPGHLMARRAGMTERQDPRMLETLLMSDIRT